MRMQTTVHTDGGAGDPLSLTLLLWAIRIILPLAAAALWLKFSSPKDKTAASAPENTLSGLFGFTWPASHRSYTVAQILHYRQKGEIPTERPHHLPNLAPHDRRHLGRKTDDFDGGYHASPAGLLTAPGGGGDRDGPRPGAFRNGARASLRRETNSSSQPDHWLPTADASQLGVTPQGGGGNSILTTPPLDSLHGGEGMQMHGGGLISAAAYQKMKTARRSFGSDDAPSYTKSPNPHTQGPATLSLQQALSAAFTNSNTLTPSMSQGVPPSKQGSALRSLTPLLTQTRDALFESPALHPPLPRPQTATSQGTPVGSGYDNSAHTANTRSTPLVEGSPDSSPPSFITANRDAVIELRKLLSTPSLGEARKVLEKLRAQGMAIAPQTYTLLVTVAILCGCKDFASLCAKEMSDAGYKLSDALQAKVSAMGTRTRNTASVLHSAATTTTLRPSDAHAPTTKLTANAPVFTPCTDGSMAAVAGQREMPRDTTSVAKTKTGYDMINAPPAAPAWLLSSQYPNRVTPSHNIVAPCHHQQHVMAGARVVPIVHYKQQGPLAWLPPQDGRAQQGPRDVSPPLPDNSPPPSDMLPQRRPDGHSAPASPPQKSVAPQRPISISGGGGAVHFHKAVSQLGAISNSAARKIPARQTPESSGSAANRRPRSTWRKKTDAT